MKIFKFRKVDAATGISVAIQKSIEGPTNPVLPGLQEIFDYNYYTYANVDDSAEPNPENFIFEITQDELTADVQSKTNELLEEWKSQVYKNEKDLRQSVFGKYDDTATSSGIYKYNDALEFKQSGQASISLEAEATARGVTVVDIADRIISNHEAFRTKEATIAGLRGRILDRLNGYVFDSDDPLGSWKELTERIEVIGQRDPGFAPIGPGPQQDLDVKVGYYSPELALRWEYLNK